MIRVFEIVALTVAIAVRYSEVRRKRTRGIEKAMVVFCYNADARYGIFGR